MKRSFRTPAEAKRHELSPDAPRFRTGEGNRRGKSRAPAGTQRSGHGGKKEGQGSEAKVSASAGNEVMRTLARRGRAVI